MKKFLFLFLLNLISCAAYVDGIHRQIDREEKVSKHDSKEDMRNFYVPKKNKFDRNDDKRPIKNPVTYSLNDGGPSGQFKPSVKRNYRPQRYKADDFTDNEDGGSLWADQGSSSSLFTYQSDKRAGDMIIINVLENLRNQISTELKRVFAENPSKTKSDPTIDSKDSTKSTAATQGPETDQSEVDMKIYDKISGTVIEEVNKDYVLVKGRKEVIFKKEKRSIEVQALVSRKDIVDNDYVNSDRLLESRVFILR